MKRILAYLLTLVLLVTAIPMSAINSKATYGYILGDVNDDSEINTKDVLLVRRYASNVVGKKALNVKAADVVADEEVNTRDVLYLRRVAAGINMLEGVNEDGKYKIGTFSIGGKNIARFTIVIPEDADECIKNAANIFATYMAKACGYTLSITNNEKSVEDYMIKFDYDRNNKLELGKEGYRVFVGDEGNLNVICGSLRGPLYAAYFMLEDLVGYRFFTFNDIEEYLFEAEKINISENYDETEIPAFKYRKISYGSYGKKESFHATRLNDAGSSDAKTGYCEGYVFTYGHSYYYQMAGWGCQDNELLDIYTRTQPCLTVEDTFEKIIKYNDDLINFRLTEWGQIPCVHYTELPCTPNDNTDFCQCTNCKKIYQEEGSIAGTVFRLSNRVIEYHKQTYSDIKLHTLAYWDARNPPKMTKPDDAVNVMYCITGCNNHTYDRTDECDACGGNYRYPGTIQNNSTEMNYLRGWLELTDNVYIYYYGISFNTLVSPCPNVMNFYNDYRYLASLGVKGSYCEGGDGYTFEKLKFYLEEKIMWDPFMTEEEYNRHINEFLMAYYGDGWEYIREYLDMQTEAGDLQGCFTNNFDRPWNMYNKDYYRDNYHYMLSLFDKALDAAKTDEQKARITECTIHLNYLGLSATYEQDYVNGTDEAKEAYAKRYADYYNYVKANNITLWSAGCLNFPTSKDDIRDTMSWYFDGYIGEYAWNAAEERWT